MKITQGLNYVFGKLFNNKGGYFNYSLNYLKRKRTLDRHYLDYIRLASLELAAEEINKKNLAGAVAELGVYKGKFARYINQYFPTRQLYLFDTFEGFNDADISSERSHNLSSGEQDFTNTSIAEVLEKMPFPKQCIVKQGYFPKTAEGVTDQFVFVSLDADLYEPILNGLKFFYPRLAKGGYIFVHDYNNDGYQGAKLAVEKFSAENGVSLVPLPDSAGTAVFVK